MSFFKAIENINSVSLRSGTLFFLLLAGNILIAQKKNGSPRSTTAEKLTFLSDSLDKEDSSLTHFEYYKPVLFVQDLGNLASPYRFMYLQVPSVIGFQTGWYTPVDYFNNPEKTRYYKAIVPYTYASYVTGQRPSNYLDYLQQVSLLHTQNWGPLFNIGVRINTNRCNGFNTKAEARTGSGDIFAWFHNRNYRYQVITNARFNNVSNNLNGGIINDSSYESSSGVTREIEGLLKDSSLFRYRAQHYYLKHFYRFGKETQQVMTRVVKRDSVVTDTLRNIDAKMQLAHSISYSREAWVYQDNIKPADNYYHNYYFDTLRTKDTLHQTTLSNLLDITYKAKNKIMLYAGYENRLHWLYLYNSKILMNESFLHANIQKLFFGDSSRGLLLNESLKFCVFNNFKEFNLGDFLMDGSASFRSYKVNFKLKSILSSQAPSLLYVYYPGNHFYWLNETLNKTNTSALIAEVNDASKKTFFKFTFAEINNYTYFDSAISVRQSDAFSYLALFWKQDFKFKVLHYTHQATWQHSSNTLALPVPKFLVKATLMFDDEWFKKALHIQFGVSASYFTKYYAPAFMPSVNVFYSQQQKQIGDYPQFDGFVNLQIQRVRIFIMLEHFNQGTINEKLEWGAASYITPHYPIANRSIRFGASWSFYN